MPRPTKIGRKRVRTYRNGQSTVGNGEHIDTVRYRGLNYPVLMRKIDGQTTYCIFCPKNGRILGPPFDTKMKAAYDYYRRH